MIKKQQVTSNLTINLQHNILQEKIFILNSLPVDSLRKYKIKTNPKMCILMYFKIQSDQPRITQSAFKKFLIYL